MTEKSGPPTPILPGGTVTFLFTDIEGSTKLLDQLRDQYAVLLTAHHQIIREALDKWHARGCDPEILATIRTGVFNIGEPKP